MKKIFFASIFLAMTSMAVMAEGVTLCTGSDTGVYHAAGIEIQKMSGSKLPITLVNTEGTLDNLDRTLTSGECDAMIGQPDGPVYVARTNPAKAKNLRQIASLHREYLHVICSRESGVDNLYDLEGGQKRSSRYR